MTHVPHPGIDAGATNAPNSDRSAVGGTQALRSDLRASSPMDAVEALAAILEPEAFDPDQPADEGWREATKQRAIAHAARVITSGWVRVVEDDDTIGRLAAELIRWVDGLGERARWTADDAARAVVRALREET